MPKVLFVVTGADRWTLNDGEVHPSGYWAEELAVPHELYTENGWDITIATPGGVAPTLDQLSLGISGGTPWKRKKVEEYLESIDDQLKNPVALDTVDADDYDLVFYPGGHGPMEDLYKDPVSGALLTKRMKEGKPLALLCHAPAAVLAAHNDDGSSPFTGKKMTGLSNREELVNGFAKKAPWYLEDKLKEIGVDYSKGTIPFTAYVVVDGNLYTGQNPQSSEKLTKRILEDFAK